MSHIDNDAARTLIEPPGPLRPSDTCDDRFRRQLDALLTKHLQRCKRRCGVLRLMLPGQPYLEVCPVIAPAHLAGLPRQWPVTGGGRQDNVGNVE
ncbi:MAG: hypothetical protein QF541_16780, partial [Lentisphaeria bacterium]|nr:hypothetical protein [Lentisphaeria bacterium]